MGVVSRSLPVRDAHAVHIGNPYGLIALWMDEEEATGLAGILSLDDAGAVELLDAVKVAYPKDSEE